MPKMEPDFKIAFAKRILNICDAKDDAAIYSLLTLLDEEPKYLKGVYGYSLGNIPKMLDSAVEIFTDEKTEIAKSSYEYSQIFKNKENFISHFSKSYFNHENETITISSNRTWAALALLSNIYLESIIRPVQFFLPHSSACSGQWAFWEESNYFELLEKIEDRNKVIELREKIGRLNLWKIKFKPADFPEIIKRRLEKEDGFNKKLDAEAMIKAMIIRMGELARPHINYEIIDYSIRSFFTYLGTKQYLRVDREIKFLRMLEMEIVKILGE